MASTTTIQVHAVTFDTDVRGPGPKQRSAFTSEYARGRKSVGMEEIAIEYDVDRGIIVLTLPNISERPVVYVPIARVRYMEPIAVVTPPVTKGKAA